MNEPVFTEDGVLILPTGWTSEQLSRWREAKGLPAIQTSIAKRNASYHILRRKAAEKAARKTNRK